LSELAIMGVVLEYSSNRVSSAGTWKKNKSIYIMFIHVAPCISFHMSNTYYDVKPTKHKQKQLYKQQTQGTSQNIN
jgi:hypothetical protein